MPEHGPPDPHVPSIAPSNDAQTRLDAVPLDHREVEEAWDRLSAVMQWLVVRRLERRSRAATAPGDS
jgi:hypothetical protein